jgi:hypothetical protein
MAWIYLAESQESLLAYRNGSGRSPIVNLLSTRGRIYSPCKLTGKYPSPQSGMISERLKGNTSLIPWTLFQVDSRARISALREMESDWKESEAAFSLKSRGWLASFDLNSFSWKTSQLSLFEGLTAFSWRSLRSGTIVDGRLSQPANLEPHTYVRGGGSLPTPTASDYGSNNHGVKEGKAKSKASLGQMARMLPTPKVSRSSYQVQKNGEKIPDLLSMAKKFIPTPRASDGEKGGPNQTIHGEPALANLAAKFLPTPQARDFKDGLTPKRHGRHSPSVAIIVAEAGHTGYLNPRFVEVLMGYPIGWTSLPAWAMRFVHKRYRKLLNACEVPRE